MKVLMTADTVGGVWTYALDLARALGDFSVEILLATMGRAPTPTQQSEAARVSHLYLCPSEYQLEWMDSPWEDVERAGEWLMDLVDCYQPDIVHLNNYAHGSLPWKAPLLMVGHSCVLSWWRAVHWENAPAAYDIYRERVTTGLRRADLVVAPTQAMLDLLNRYYGPFSQQAVIYNARTPDSFVPKSKEPIILAVGRLWDQAKNLAALEAVAPALPWPVYVAGETAHPMGGQRMAHYTEPLGFLSPEEITDWMGRASIYVLPARYEPFGLSVLEAALCGCALVLGDLPTLREVWGDAALYVPPHEPEALREQLEQLIEDRGLREEMAQRAYRRAQCYQPHTMAAAYWSAYQALVGQPDHEVVSRAQALQSNGRLRHPAVTPGTHRRPRHASHTTQLPVR
jgi:glycogen synthase